MYESTYKYALHQAECNPRNSFEKHSNCALVFTYYLTIPIGEMNTLIGKQFESFPDQNIFHKILTLDTAMRQYFQLFNISVSSKLKKTVKVLLVFEQFCSTNQFTSN